MNDSILFFGYFVAAVALGYGAYHLIQRRNSENQTDRTSIFTTKR